MSCYSVALVGPKGVGKSSLVIQMVHNHFVEEYDPEIWDSYRKRMMIDGEACVLDILDPALSYTDILITSDYITSRQGFLCIYSVNSRESFNIITPLRSHLLTVKGKDTIPLIIVGNKCDMTERNICTTEGQELATLFSCPFFETSAKTGTNCREILIELVREIHRLRPVVGIGDQDPRRNRRKCSLL